MAYVLKASILGTEMTILLLANHFIAASMLQFCPAHVATINREVSTPVLYVLEKTPLPNMNLFC